MKIRLSYIAVSFFLLFLSLRGAAEVPAAAGTITGTALVCQGQNAVSYSVPIITNATSYTWAYSGTGATISNGTTNSISISFAVNASAGNLTVMGTNSSGNGPVSANYPITMNPLPVAAGTITGTSTVCQGQNTMSYSVATITNATSYTWVYSGSGATISGTTDNVTISFAASATSGNLTVRGTNSCGNGTISANYPITMNPLPVAAGTITGTSTVCQGQNTVSYSVPVITNATSYTWAYSGTGATITGTTSTVTITFEADATSGNLTVRGTNSCGNGTISANYPIAVNSVPAAAGTIAGSVSVCQGQNTVSYSVPVITDATSYTWAYSGTGATISNGTTNSISISFAANATSGNLTVRGINSCGNGIISANYAITVNPLPVAAGTITGTLTVCQGENAVSYSIPVITNATSYTWAYTGSGVTISNGSTNSILISFAANASAGNLTVIGTNSCGNGTISANYPITMNALPVAAGTITGTPTVCRGQNTVSYSVPVITNATSYTWAYSGTGATISNGSSNSISISFAANASAGNLTVIGTNSCGNGTISANYPITMNPLPVAAGIITGTPTVCRGQNTVSYSVPVITDATSYTWTYSGTGATISNGTTNSISISFAANATSGNLTVMGTNSCGNGTISANYPITVNSVPAAAGTIAGSVSVCQGQNAVSYSVPVITNATSYSWAYTGTGATISNGTTNSISINFATNASSGNLTVMGTNSCGDGTISANYLITVNPVTADMLPYAAGTIAGTASVCQGQTIVSYSVPVITNATSYAWAYSGIGAAINGTTNSISISFAANATSGNLTVIGTSPCGNGTISPNYPITVNQLPDAAGTITGLAAVCEGLTGVNYFVPLITGATGYNWTLPSGVVVTGGTNTNSILVNFPSGSVSGNITVTGTNTCGSGITSLDFAVTVSNYTSLAGNISGTPTVCQGQTSVVYSVQTIPEATSYIWAYSGTGATINGTTNSITVTFSATATSGNLTVMGTNSCGNGTVSVNYPIAVNSVPAASGIINGTASVCQGQTAVSYSVAAITNATSYTWAYSGSGATISGTTNNVTVTFATNATSGNLTVMGTNSCGNGTVSANYPITVNPLPAAAGIISGLSPVCRGQNTVSYSVAAITNATSYSWSYSGSGATINGTTNNITINFSANATAGSLTVMGHNDCGDGIISANFPITINSLPAAAGIISGLSPVCQGQTAVSYSVAAITDATSYTWAYSGSGATISGTTNNVTVTFATNATSGNLTVMGTNSCGNGTISSIYPINVSTLPAAAGTITGIASVCQGQNAVSYSVGVITNATSYSWSYSGSGATISGTTNNITINFSTNATSGNLNVAGTSCGNGTISANYHITVNPLPDAAGAIIGLVSVCQEQNAVSYSVPVITNATSYTWAYTGTGATISNGTTNSISISFAANASSGNLTVMGTNSCGNGTISANFLITINSLPASAGTITGLASVCQGQTDVSYSVPVITNATSYTWAYSGTGATINGTTNYITITFAANATAGNLTVMGTHSCGNGTISANYPITMNPLPAAAGTITGTPTVCQGQNTVSYSVPVITNATSYTWAYSGIGATINGTTNNITVNFAANATSGNLTVAGTSCGNGTISANYPITVNPLPDAAGAITGLTTACEGQTGVSYIVGVISGATGYTWTLPTGATIASGGNTNDILVDFSVGAMSGNITVAGTNACGSGVASPAFPVTVSTNPASAGNISGTPTVCQGQTSVAYSVQTIPGATSYIWAFTGTGATINGTTKNITITFSVNATAGNLTVMGTNSCGNGTISASYPITMNTLPAAAGTITGTTSVCQGQTAVSYSVPAIANATGHSWTIPSGATIVGGTNTNSITVDYSTSAISGNITVQGTNACGAGSISAPYAVTVNLLPSAAGTIIGLSAVCEGENGIIYSVSPILNVTDYNWTLPTGATIVAGGNTNAITVNFTVGAISGNISVYGTNSCGNGLLSVPFPITVNTLPPAAGIITGASTVCQGQVGVVYSVQAIPRATGYNWTIPAGASIISGSNTSSILVDYSSGASTGFITVQGTSACGSGTVSASYPVTVNISPVAAYQFSNNSCADEAVPFTDQSLENGGGNISSWQWNFGDPASGTNNISALRNPTHAFTSSGPHTVTLTITNSNNCPNTVSHIVDIYLLPVADFSNTSPCLGNAIMFTDLSFANSLSIATWDWDFGDGTTHSSLQNPTHTYAVLGNYNITLIVTNSNGCVNTITKSVQIIPPPIAAFYTSAENCAGAPVQFTDQSSTSFGYILKWTWDFGDGTNPVTINYSNPGNTLHSYSLSGTYNATLTVETSDHCTSIISHSVIVTPGPTANYIYGANLCFGLPVQFTDQSQTNGAGPLTMWQWNFDDPGSGTNNTSTQPNPSHTFAAAGIHLVTLKVTNINSCTNTINKQVKILNLLVANFSADTTCLGAATTFKDLSIPNTLPIASWDWDFGDGSAHSTIKNPTHTFALGGTQLVTLTVANSNGCTHSVTKPVMVIVPPGAAFVTSAQTCAVSPIQFTDQSTASHGFINKWTWDFGDGTPPVVISYPGSSNVAHTYSAGGTYNTTLTIQTSDLCLSSISHQVIVTGAPLANYNFTNNLCLGKSVQFTDLSQTNGGGAISSWLWNFNDPTSGVSNTSSLQSPVHIFSIAGTHNVTLTTTNVDNCSGTISKQIIVGAGPAVKFIITSDTCVGSDISFEPDPAVMDPASVASYLWNFGDGGATSTSSAPTHVYNMAGTFQVTMSVVYNNGCTNSETRQVTIGAPPVAAFISTSACLDNATKFTDYSYTGSGEPIVSWLWKFNETNVADSSIQRNPVFKYTAQGTYDVTLTVTTANGCPGSKTIPVQVFPAPIANFNYFTNACANGNVSFQDSSINNLNAITEWKWEFEPGYISTLKNPNHTFNNTDSSYNVRLVVTDMRGCLDTLAKDVYVPAGLEVDITYTPACFGDSILFGPLAPAGDSLIAFQWNFGDLASGIHNTSSLRRPFHYFQTQGSYLVSLTATDTNNCSKTVYHQVDIQELAVPVFSYTIADCDSVVHFNASPTGGSVGIKSWIWNFGDGKSDTINVPPGNGDTLHIYTSPGIYYVTMTVINRSGCSASFSDSLLVKPCLDAIFTEVDTLGCQNQVITFVDNSSSGVPLLYPITEWFWDFGDGSDSTYNAYQDTITHIFNTSGTFNVKLVISAQIAGKTISDSDSLKVLINPSPIAGYTAADVCLGIPAKFNNTSSGNGSQISSYTWDFDPGTTLDSTSANNPTYLYNRSGAFNVALIAMNPFGCSDTIIHTLTVHPLPKADFQFTNSCAGFPTYFTDISDTVNAALIKWQWVFMDTILIKYDTLPNPDYLFATKGNHQVRLIITDKNGCQDDTLKPVITYPVTVSAFEIKEDYDNIQGRIHLINKTLNATGYEWDFGDGFTSIEKEPTITYNSEGTYIIKLSSYIYSQCTDIDSISYTLMFKGLYVPNAFSAKEGPPYDDFNLFKPKGINLLTYEVEVYDSWGKLIWSSKSLDPNGSPDEVWDGTAPNGKLLPQDVYVWRISAVFKDGTVWNSKNAGDHTNIPEKTYGTVTLLR